MAGLVIAFPSGFRATGDEPFAISAEGSTRDDALNRLRELIEARTAAGAEIVTLDLAISDRPVDSRRFGEFRKLTLSIVSLVVY